MLTQGNALRIPLADESVHCCVCSPPYWKLRDYGTATWEGGDPECDHKANYDAGVSGNKGNSTTHPGRRDNCTCGAIRIDNQLGLEPTPDQYVENMVAVFREVKRVMRHDATCWINLGDSYARNPGKGVKFEGPSNIIPQMNIDKLSGPEVPSGLKEKDLCGIPWRLAFALQADGWWLRSDIIWSKPNPMPESVTDRPTKAHEYLFLLTKSAKYYYDNDAVREGYAQASIERQKYPVGTWDEGLFNTKHTEERRMVATNPSGRNKRTVWTIPTKSYSGAHFATFPPALVEPCIQAGTSERGVCPECGAPWERVVEKSTRFEGGSGKAGTKAEDIKGKWGDKRYGENILLGPVVDVQTLGWQPTCECWRDMPDPDAPRTRNSRKRYQQDMGGYWKFRAVCRKGKTDDATIFDPFVGSGTTLQVARALGRNGVGLDLSLEYLHLARKRLSLDALDAWGKAKTPGLSAQGQEDGKAVTDLPMFGGQDEPR